MNDRIKKITEQARQYAEEHRPGSFVKYDPVWFGFYNEKIAELIVHKCIDLVGDGGEFASRPKIVERIKQYFGVEE